MKSIVHFIELIFIISILVAIGVPLFSKIPRRSIFNPPDKDLEDYKHLLVRKEEVLLSIKELEFDFKTEKISPEDYEVMRKKLETEAIGILDRIDQLENKRKKGKVASAHVDVG